MYIYIYIYEHGISMKAVGSNPQDIPSTSTALGKKDSCNQYISG